MQRFRDLSIKWKLVLTISLLVLAIAAFLVAYFPQQQGRIAVRGLEDKAVRLAEMMAYSVRAGMEFGDLAAVQNVFIGVQDDPDLRCAKAGDVREALFVLRGSVRLGIANSA